MNMCTCIYYSVDDDSSTSWPVWFGTVRKPDMIPYWEWLSGANFNWQPWSSFIVEAFDDCGYMESDGTWQSVSDCETSSTEAHSYVCEISPPSEEDTVLSITLIINGDWDVLNILSSILSYI